MGEDIKKDELNLIKNSVKEKGLRWEPKETDLSKLNITGRRNRCGVLYDDKNVKRIHKYLEIKNKKRPIGGEILEN